LIVPSTGQAAGQNRVSAGEFMTNFHDNPFEVDGGMHNIRVMRNMMINSASHAFCSQPANGGPVYWVRTLRNHLPGGSTRLTNGSSGVLFYNNTMLSETQAAATSNTHWRNNLFLGENTQPVLFGVNTFTSYTSSEPPSHRTGSPERAVDYDIFVKVPKLDRNDLANVQKIYKAEDYDFRLKPGWAAVDKGVAMANVNDRFAGSAPDLGALEVGEPVPHYGPR